MARLVAFGLVALVLLAGCGGGGDDASSAEPPDELSLELDEENDSNVTGLRVVLTPEGDSRTRIEVDGLDEGEPAGGGANAVHLHRGTCDAEQNGGTTELGELSGSELSAEVDVPIDELLGGGYVVDVHLPPIGEQADGTPEVIGCGELAELSTEG